MRKIIEKLFERTIEQIREVNLMNCAVETIIATTSYIQSLNKQQSKYP
jgi:hypothetical protein